MKIIFMADTISKDMRAWRKSQLLTQAQAGAMIGISREYWAIMERGDQPPSKDVRPKLIDLIGNIAQTELRRVSLLFGSMTRIQVVGSVGAGEGVSNIDVQQDEIWVPQSLSNIGGIGYLVEGESMMPALHPGDIALFKQSPHIRKGFTYLLKTRDAEYRVKNLEWIGTEWKAVSLNPDRERFPVEGIHDTQVLGVLVGWYRSIGSYEKLEADPHGLRLDSPA